MNNADGIKSKLRDIAIRENKSLDYLLLLYLIERLLYRLSVSKYSVNFILKGGLLLHVILANDARTTKDIDFLAKSISNDLDKMKNIFSEICNIMFDDAARFDPASIKVENINEGADYKGVRVKLTGYLDKSRYILQFDISFGDVIVPKSDCMEYPSILNMERPRINVYSLESVIAEKFQAMIYLAEVNSRMKDFYDIYSLCRSYNFNGDVLCEAISQTFKHRSTSLIESPTIFSDEFAQNQDKQILWQAFQRRIRVASETTFFEVINMIKVFLEPVYRSMLEHKVFHEKWDFEKGSWKNN